MKLTLVLPIILSLLCAGSAATATEASVDAQIQHYAQSLTGISFKQSEIAALHTLFVSSDGALDTKQLFSALEAQPEFADYRLATFVSQMSNEEADPTQDVDDFQTALGLAITSDLDIRMLFQKSFFITRTGKSDVLAPSSENYGEERHRTFSNRIQAHSLNFNPTEKSTPVGSGFYQDGLMSTQGFSKRFMAGGTNRKAIRAAYNVFLCSPIESWQDNTLDPFYIGRDVDHKPGGLAQTFNDKCQSCHAPMDAQRGALAHYNYDTNMDQLVYDKKVQPKMNQNATVYPQGYQMLDDSWENLLVQVSAQERFGWRGKTSGNGLLEFSAMISNARQFQTCMVQRLLVAFCDRNEDDLHKILRQPEFQTLVAGMRDNGYKMKTLIENIVKSDLCVSH